jgi:hypothetical protein
MNILDIMHGIILYAGFVLLVRKDAFMKVMEYGDVLMPEMV